MEKQEKLSHLKNLERFWKGNTNSIWLATTLCLHRNIEKFPFPQRLETSKKKELAELIFGTMKDLSLLKNPVESFFDSMAALERDFLYEQFLIFEPLKDSLLGQSFLFDEQGDFLAQVNVQDHIELLAIETTEKLEKSLEKLQTLERGMEKSIAFAFSPKFGYLTEDPTLAGTGLVVRAYLHVPALIETGEMMALLENGSSEGVTVTGLHGSNKELIGDMIVVSNLWTLGTTEEAILSLIRTTALAIMSHEQEMRQKLSNPRNDLIFDRVSRMLGTLKYSQTMDTGEALRNLSLAKLGIEEGWIQGISIESINQQFFNVRRAHLASQFEWKLSQEETNHERARRLRALFENVSLVS